MRWVHILCLPITQTHLIVHTFYTFWRGCAQTSAHVRPQYRCDNGATEGESGHSCRPAAPAQLGYVYRELINSVEQVTAVLGRVNADLQEEA